MTGRVCPVHGEYAADGVCRWCEKPSGADQSTIALPLMCICKTCLRGFEAPIPLTSLECPECRSAARVGEARDMLGPPPDVAKILRTYKPEFLARIGFTWTESVIDAETHAAEESRLLAQHAALRWERVARRWATKHGPWTMRDVAFHWQSFLNVLIAKSLRRINEITLDKEPKP